MVTNKTRDKVARRTLRRSVELLSPEARETVIEGLCIPQCGREPDGEFCPTAKRSYRIVLSILLKTHMGQN